MNRNEWISQQYKYLHSIHNTHKHTHAYMDCFCLSSARFVYFTAQKLVLFSNFSCQLLLWFFYMCLFAPHCCHGKSQYRTIFFLDIFCVFGFISGCSWLEFYHGKIEKWLKAKKVEIKNAISTWCSNFVIGSMSFIFFLWNLVPSTFWILTWNFLHFTAFLCL